MERGRMTKNIDREAIRDLALTWVAWTLTRRFFAPPIPINMLAKMQQDQSRSGEPPDAKLIPLCSAFNLVMQSAAPDERLPFLYVYLKEYRPKPIKTLAHDLGIDSDTVYWRAHDAAIKYFNMAHLIAEAHSKIVREVEDFIID